MKYVKMLGFAAVAAAALMAFVGTGTASASTLTDGSGTVLGVGTEIKAENTETVTLHPPIGAIECEHSTVAGKVTNAGGTTHIVHEKTKETTTITHTVKGDIETLTFTECNATVTVLKKGTLEIHSTAAENDNKGILTSSGAEVTVEFVGFHCIFSTNSTSIGTVTGGNPAKLAIEATIPRTGGRSGAFCGTTAQWTGGYEVTAPKPLNIH